MKDSFFQIIDIFPFKEENAPKEIVPFKITTEILKGEFVNEFVDFYHFNAVDSSFKYIARNEEFMEDEVFKKLCEDMADPIVEYAIGIKDD